MAADFLRTRHHFNELVRQILWMGCHKADAADSFHLLHPPQQLGKGNGVLQIFSVGIDILSQEHNLHHALRGQALHLPQDFLGFAASLPPPHIGHNAVAAEIVAAKHDIDPGFKGIFAVRGQILHNLVRPLPHIHKHFPLFPGAGSFLPAGQAAVHQLRQLKHIVGAEDQIHKGIALFDPLHLVGLLHHAAAQAHNGPRMALLPAPGLSQVAVDLQVCILPHRAGVVEDQVRLLILPHLIADAL